MKIYNKLVRDKIPEIIKASGKNCNIHIAAKEEYTKLLEEKLQEEVNEYIEDKSLEELADILEVVYGLTGALGYTEEELIKARNDKAKERGGFRNRIVLKSVDELSRDPEAKN